MASQPGRPQLESFTLWKPQISQWCILLAAFAKVKFMMMPSEHHDPW